MFMLLCYCCPTLQNSIYIYSTFSQSNHQLCYSNTIKENAKQAEHAYVAMLLLLYLQFWFHNITLKLKCSSLLKLSQYIWSSETATICSIFSLMHILYVIYINKANIQSYVYVAMFLLPYLSLIQRNSISIYSTFSNYMQLCYKECKLSKTCFVAMLSLLYLVSVPYYGENSISLHSMQKHIKEELICTCRHYIFSNAYILYVILVKQTIQNKQSYIYVAIYYCCPTLA